MLLAGDLIPATPPVAQIIPRIDTIHNDIRIDNYFWLRDRDDPRVMQYLNDENEYTEQIMAATAELQDSLYKEMLGRIKETDLNVPWRSDSFYYYSRTEQGKQYLIYCRKKWNLDAAEEIILDHNVLAESYEYYDIGSLSVSPDHRMIAYSVDTTGRENMTIFFKDLRNGKLMSGNIPNTGYPMAWANDNITFFYATTDETNRPHKIYSHKLNGEQPDKLIFEEKDISFWVDIKRTKDGHYLIIETGTHITTENYYLNADIPDDDFSIIDPRTTGIEYYIYHHNGYFYSLTNKNAPNFMITRAKIEKYGIGQWKKFISHQDSIKIETIEPFNNYIVIHERKHGLEQLEILNLREKTRHLVEFPESTYTFWLHDNHEFNCDTLRLTYMSLITPKTVYDYNMKTHQLHLKKQFEVLGNYDPAKYRSGRLMATGQDSTLIPISIVYRIDRQKANGPLVLDGYGAYGSSNEPYFSSNRLSLIDRGFAYAIAQVRGGGEMGRYWYDQGRLLNKLNTFYDFISCAEYLIDNNYTSKDSLVISGASAGGLLIGAVLNMNPDLCAIAIADVPFVDVINTMLDPTIPLTTLEYDEWGDPNNTEYYEYMKNYSPYDNVSQQEYPNILVTAGLNDPRVGYWESAKWVARLRTLKTDNNFLLLKTNLGTGHMGSSGRYDYLKEIAFEYAFILEILNKKE
ncbi:oligopeptidase B [candidate division WOR-3 bacterium RBG_13_43_14]|uniref:Oligopeptidase B n=1 Tax=candidate division WOR-3 bacterium RBG_13_43_14 TaxID=1802590 RepID=A0A1F4UBY5_UNCW3|nr:MAG: oligopeptidase B [candidate division WOR-3 bacterium RBG_13_43_14]